MPIYPKQVARMRVPIREKTCFVLMPFSPDFNAVYAEIKGCMTTLGFDCKRADDIFASGAIVENVILAIKASQLVIADLSTKNPNVFYDLGMTHVIKDNPSVILICQDIREVPVDLTHNLIITYTADNLKGLYAGLAKAVRDNRAFFEGRARLFDRYHYLLGAGDELERVVEFLDRHGRTLWELLLAALGLEDRQEIGERNIAATFFVYRDGLNRVFAEGDVFLFRNLYQIFIDVMINLISVAGVRDFAVSSLTAGRVQQLEAEPDKCMIDFAIAAYAHPELKREALHWVFEYLRRDKVAGIDLNRSKVEAFVLRNAPVDREIKDHLLDALNDHGHLKEVAADALGELRNADAIPHLALALRNERSNPYVARSIFSALGKIGAALGGPEILSWLRDNADWITERKLDFVYMRAEEALLRIDEANHTTFLRDFLNLRSSIRPKKAQSRRPRKPRKSG